MDLTADAISKLLNVGHDTALPRLLPPLRPEDGVSHFIIKQDQRIEAVDLERYLPNPRRDKGTYKVADISAFAQQWARHATSGKSVIYAPFDRSTGGLKLIGVANESLHGEPGHADLRVCMEPSHSEEWKTFFPLMNHYTPQREFAETLEDNTEFFVLPSGASILMLALKFEANTDTAFKTAIRLDNGDTRLEYSEETKTNIVIPDKVTLLLRLFEDSPPEQLTCRFRYRVADGKLGFMLKPIALADFLRQQYDDFIANLIQKTEWPASNIIDGTPR